ncbi:MAG: sigma-70 family RNA polymerase sigma factor [Mesorhizobium sp.]
MTGSEDADLARLLREAIAGSEKAYAEFLHRTAVLVRGYCRRKIVHGGVDPEDVVQETLLAIHLKRHTWRQDASVLPWVFTIARFKLVDAFRRRGRRVEVDIEDFADTIAQPETEAVSDREISGVLLALTAGQKAVVRSVSVDGRSIAETAAKLGMTEVAVRVALHRGLIAIARRFGK